MTPFPGFGSTFKKRSLPKGPGFFDLEMEYKQQRMMELHSGLPAYSTFKGVQKRRAEEYKRQLRDIIAAIVDQGDPISLCVNASDTLFTIFIKNRPPNGPDENFSISEFKYKTMTPDSFYKLLIETVNDWGIPTEVLKERIGWFEFENDPIFPEVGKLLKARINPDLILFPYLPPYVGREIMNKVREAYADALGIKQLQWLLRPLRDKRAKQFKEHLDGLMNPNFEKKADTEEFFIEFADSAATFLNYVDSISGDEFRLKTTALHVADLADIAAALKLMKEQQISIADTGLQFTAWHAARPLLLAVKAGKGPLRQAVLGGQKAAKSTQGDSLGFKHLKPIVDDISAICDKRFPTDRATIKPDIKPTKSLTTSEHDDEFRQFFAKLNAPTLHSG